MPQTLPGSEVLDDLCARFILNAPPEERESFERLLFQVELAHWYYEDHWRQEHPDLRTLSLKEFTGLIFKQCGCLQQYSHLLTDILKRFVAYKLTVPCMGAILLDPSMQKCLLVRGFKSHSSWGFPRGKVNRNEPDIDCAIREVLEETSVDIAAKVREENSFEVHVKQQRQKLYIVPEVGQDTPLAPSMKGEIGAYGWFPIDQLPDSFEANQQGYRSADGTRHSFHNVWQFVGRLKRWIRRTQGRQAAKGSGRKSNHGKQKGAKSVTSSSSLSLQNGNVTPNERSGALVSAQPAQHRMLSNGHAVTPAAADKPKISNGTANPMSASSSSSGSQESTHSHAHSARQHAWLGFKLNAAPILDQLK